MAKSKRKKAKKKSRSRRDLKVQYVPIKQLREFTGNPRKNEHTVEQVVKSIKAFGFTNPILVRRADNVIIAGHTRVKALRQLGRKEAPVIFLDLNETDSRVYAVFDNKSVELAQWDFPKLADLFVEFDQLDVDMGLTGFAPGEIEDIAVNIPDYKDLDDQNESLEGMEDEELIVVIPKKYINQVKKCLAGGAEQTQTKMGKGVLKKCGLL